jgi:hypothetical protein
MSAAENVADMLERRKSYLLNNRIVMNTQRVSCGQPRKVKVWYK